jgi:hypothetical protein
MMPADLMYVLSDDRHRVALNRARAERVAAHDRQERSRRRRARERAS